MNSPGQNPLEWTLIVAVNDAQVLHDSLLRSPVIDAHCEVILKHFHRCVGTAYNEAIDQASHDLLVFAHQDVYLPEGWTARLARALAILEEINPRWGILGPIGVGLNGEVCGHVYSTGLRNFVGAPGEELYEAVSLDEMVLVGRRSSGLRFDEAMPGFHLYGTDICMEARWRGLSNYVIPAFCIHNSKGLKRLPPQFWTAYAYLRRKWRGQLPIETCCIRISRSCWPPIGKRLREILRRAELGLGNRVADPRALYRTLLANWKGDTD